MHGLSHWLILPLIDKLPIKAARQSITKQVNCHPHSKYCKSDLMYQRIPKTVDNLTKTLTRLKSRTFHSRLLFAGWACHLWDRKNQCSNDAYYLLARLTGLFWSHLSYIINHHEHLACFMEFLQQNDWIAFSFPINLWPWPKVKLFILKSCCRF